MMIPASQEGQRPSLREFQKQLASRLQQAQQVGAGVAAVVAVSTARGHWLLNAAQVVEIIAMPALTPVPLTRPWFMGLIHHRSRFISVIDLDAFVAGPVSEAHTGDRLLVLPPASSMHCALRIARVHTLLDPSPWQAAGRTPHAPRWTGTRLTDGEQRCWTRIDVDALLRDPQLIDIGLY